MITTEYSVAGPVHISIAIVADLHEFEPKPVLSRLAEIHPDVIAVPGDLFENHEFGENLDKEDQSFVEIYNPHRIYRWDCPQTLHCY